MPESPDQQTPAGVRVVTPDEEEARTIARAMASSTAGGILRLFQGGELTASDIGTTLKIPIPTVMYHLDALLEAGLIEVSRIRYSVKGREVKVYRQSDQVFIVAPRRADIREALIKYASLFGLTFLCAGIASFLSREWVTQGIPVKEAMGGAAEKSIFAAVANSPADALSNRAADGYALAEMASPPLSLTSPDSAGFLIPDLALGILIGGCIIIAVCILLDMAALRKREKLQ